jgi:allantoin racemase
MTGNDAGATPSPKRIKVIVPVPLPAAALRTYEEQVPPDLVAPGYEVEFVGVRNGGVHGGNLYEALLYEVFVLDAGSKAEEQGYSAICINSMSDSGVGALRSRLKIPVVGTGQATLLLACLLGRKFSIITMWRQWEHFYLKILSEQGLTSRLASIRSIDVEPDPVKLLGGKTDEIATRLEQEARAALEHDHADVIILGSTTMHQANAHLAAALPVPVINPGAVAYKMCELLLATGLTHSKAAFGSPAHLADDLFSCVPSRYPS